MGVEALVSLKREDLPAVGRDRVRLLEAVAREGGISAGARAVGITYRAAWDALEAMSNVFATPLIETRVGGRQKGGATLTAAGQRVIGAFHRLEAEMARLTRDFDAELAGSGLSSRELVSGFFFKTSARNMLRGAVAAINRKPLSSEITVALNPSASIVAQVTNRSVEELGLHVGRDVLALVKAPFVAVVAKPPRNAASTRNCIEGRVRRCDIRGDQAETILDIGEEKTIAALTSADAAQKAGLTVGKRAFALFDASQVILAID